MSYRRIPAEPHPLTLFSLIPLQQQTIEDILDLPDNCHLVSFVPGARNHVNPTEEARGINVGFQIGTKSSHTLASIGRNADISVRGATIARIQCIFEIHEVTKAILLYDRSSSGSTQTFGPDAKQFELGRSPRRVLVAHDINTRFGFGGSRCDLFQFEIYWNERPLNVSEQISYREDHPRFTRTMDETPTALPSKHYTRIHTPSSHGPKTLRHHGEEKLGKGAFGEVSKVVDVDSGSVLALKRIPWPKNKLADPMYIQMKREAEIFYRISHPNIVPCLHVQGYDGPHLELFTEVREGSVDRLIEENKFDIHVAESFLRQMLEALDYLASQGIVHRDFKPENVLYRSLATGGYNFQLTDFGLCNMIDEARTTCGSLRYAAPEVCRGELQTAKVDVWSLFITLAYALDVDGYRMKSERKLEDRIKAAQEAANTHGFQSIREMAAIEPDDRPSAGQMLDKLFKGEGRSTPRVPTLQDALGKDKTVKGRLKAKRMLKATPRTIDPKHLRKTRNLGLAVTEKHRRVPGQFEEY